MLSLLVINYKNPPLLCLGLKSLEKSIGSSLDYEIIVIDSASSLETRSIVSEEFPKAKLYPFKENIGYTKGVNEGIKAARGDLVMILNPDIIPVDGSIKKLVDFMKQNEDVGLAGPQLFNFDGTPQDSCFRFYSPLTVFYRRTFLGKLPFGKKKLDHFLMRDVNLKDVANVDWISGSAMMASKKAIDKVGLMDEKLFLYMSDVDWARKFWENGLRVVYYPFAQMYHYHRRSSKGKLGPLDIFIRKEARWHFKDALRYFLKYRFSTK